MIFAISFCSATFVAFLIISPIISNWLNAFSNIGVGIAISVMIAIALEVFAISRTLKFFTLSVPEVTGLLTINLLKDGEMRPYGTGLHFRYPWEQIKEGNYINLRIVTSEKIKQTYPSLDGIVMLAEWTFQYIARLRLLGKYIAVDETTINKGLTDVGSGLLSSMIANRKAEDCKKDQEKLRKDFVGDFEKTIIKENTMDTKLEDHYGVDITTVSLADLDYEKKFQNVKTSEQVANKIKDIAKNLQRTGESKEERIKYKDALNSALIINGDISKSVQEVEGEGLHALAGIFMAGMRAAGGKMKGGRKNEQSEGS
jgi:uncharacterized protein YnzC (UPF0291/DUF896 family)